MSLWLGEVRREYDTKGKPLNQTQGKNKVRLNYFIVPSGSPVISDLRGCVEGVCGGVQLESCNHCFLSGVDVGVKNQLTSLMLGNSCDNLVQASALRQTPK